MFSSADRRTIRNTHAHVTSKRFRLMMCVKRSNITVKLPLSILCVGKLSIEARLDSLASGLTDILLYPVSALLSYLLFIDRVKC